MARMIPAAFPYSDRDLGAERVVYHALARQLSPEFVVFWSISTLGPSPRQLDFVVLHPDLGLAVIEVKGGRVEVGNPFDARTAWTSVTRWARRANTIDNPLSQAQGAAMAFVSDWKANSGENGYYTVTPLVVLPHTPRTAAAGRILDQKASHFAFENDMPKLGDWVVYMMKSEMAAERAPSPLGMGGIESLVALYGRQHDLPPSWEGDCARSTDRGEVLRQIRFGLLIGLPLAGVIVMGAFGYNWMRSHKESAVVGIDAGSSSPPAPRPISGLASMVNDTATISINGLALHLAGLQAVNRPEARAAGQVYLDRAGSLDCVMDERADGWRCVSMAKGIDIAEVFALSGFAKASADAAPVIRDAERMARQNRRGIWAD